MFRNFFHLTNVEAFPQVLKNQPSFLKICYVMYSEAFEIFDFKKCSNISFFKHIHSPFWGGDPIVDSNSRTMKCCSDTLTNKSVWIWQIVVDVELQRQRAVGNSYGQKETTVARRVSGAVREAFATKAAATRNGLGKRQCVVFVGQVSKSRNAYSTTYVYNNNNNNNKNSLIA